MEAIPITKAFSTDMMEAMGSLQQKGLFSAFPFPRLTKTPVKVKFYSPGARSEKLKLSPASLLSKAQRSKKPWFSWKHAPALAGLSLSLSLVLALNSPGQISNQCKLSLSLVSFIANPKSLDSILASETTTRKQGITTFENRYFVERRHWGKYIGASSNADLQFKLTWIDRSVLSIPSCVHVNYDLAKSAGHPLGTKMSKSPKSMMESREQLRSEMERKGQIADESRKEISTLLPTTPQSPGNNMGRSLKLLVLM